MQILHEMRFRYSVCGSMLTELLLSRTCVSWARNSVLRYLPIRPVNVTVR